MAKVKLSEISISDTEYGVRYEYDPASGEYIGRPLTREEALESDRKFSEKFEPDFTEKALRDLYRPKSVLGQKSPQ